MWNPKRNPKKWWFQLNYTGFQHNFSSQVHSISLFKHSPVENIMLKSVILFNEPLFNHVCSNHNILQTFLWKKKYKRKLITNSLDWTLTNIQLREILIKCPESQLFRLITQTLFYSNVEATHLIKPASFSCKVIKDNGFCCIFEGNFDCIISILTIEGWWIGFEIGAKKISSEAEIG